ncbi:MAG: 2Fe-2S iron-sulfur cluster-binding protein [Gammaproteobacteria bacterium]|nr:2Fe-2S iron-sulfur cluster-binding protein [Gammaproteobacteria bacterium]MCY4217875.1 2Fe-2S iron-sulfur cluster-binding protein [Gammaproteobacteria bacterium]MCY4276219.1 2Fe-2S iron-sulfur cluster-binding protein [Gammaproteobacteria bacterium]
MPSIHYILYDGSEYILDALLGESVMIVAKNNNLQGILAECGGACSCATCHVHIDPFWVDRLPPKEVLEEEMLEFVEDADETSRLSCQLKITEDMDGLIVNVPEEQY